MVDRAAALYAYGADAARGDPHKPPLPADREGRLRAGGRRAPPGPRDAGVGARRVTGLLENIRGELLPGLLIESPAPHHDPVVVRRVPAPWVLLGAGNYAAVFCHPGHPEQVAKVYAPRRPGLAEEAEVYRRLGPHPAFSECLHAGKGPAGEGFLILRRLGGTTLYDCLRLGMPIPERAIEDVNGALAYARGRGLRPHDVHGRNVMVLDGRGLVVDVSDFLHEEACPAWDDFKKFYYLLYRPLLRPLGLRVPRPVLEAVRKLHRRFRRPGDRAVPRRP